MQISESTRSLWALLTKHQNDRGVVKLSREEMMEALGYTSVAPVNYHLVKLKELGYISWQRHQKRIITVVVGLHTNCRVWVKTSEVAA